MDRDTQTTKIVKSVTQQDHPVLDARKDKQVL